MGINGEEVIKMKEELKINKIGLDIDSTIEPIKTQRMIMDYYRELVDNYDVYLSSSGKGLHFEIYLRKPISISKSFEIREHLGDDRKRIAFSKADLLRGWDFDILFKYKKIGGVWKKRKFLFNETIC